MRRAASHAGRLPAQSTRKEPSAPRGGRVTPKGRGRGEGRGDAAGGAGTCSDSSGSPHSPRPGLRPLLQACCSLAIRSPSWGSAAPQTTRGHYARLLGKARSAGRSKRSPAGGLGGAARRGSAVVPPSGHLVSLPFPEGRDCSRTRRLLVPTLGPAQPAGPQAPNGEVELCGQGRRCTAWIFRLRFPAKALPNSPLYHRYPPRRVPLS